MQHVKKSKISNPIPPFRKTSFLKFATLPRDRKWHISKSTTLPRAPYQPHAKNKQQHRHQGTEKRENLPMPLIKATNEFKCPELYKWDSILYLTRHGKTQSPLRTPSARHHHAADCRKGQESRNAIVLCSHESTKGNSPLKGGNHSGAATTKTGFAWIHIVDHSAW